MPAVPVVVLLTATKLPPVAPGVPLILIILFFNTFEVPVPKEKPEPPNEVALAEVIAPSLPY